jgi:hypothetical protein
LEFESKGGGTLGKLDILAFVSCSTHRGKVTAAIQGGLWGL